MVLTAAYCNLGGSIGTIHDHSPKIELAVEVEDKDVTTYASLGWKEHLGGLKSGTLGLSILQDIANGSLDGLFWAQIGNVVTFEVRLTQASVGVSNPKYTGSILVNGWKPISGSVGDVATVDVSYPTTGVVTRATA
ncbi:MAG: hypothetical protein V4515_14940 [Chloroflexota bacterium]